VIAARDAAKGSIIGIGGLEQLAAGVLLQSLHQSAAISTQGRY
jgi:hypothetical protein